MDTTLRVRLLVAVAAAACALGGCGGGGGSGIASTPPPPPAPLPPPPPPPPPTRAASPAIFPSVTANTEFATMGLEAGASGTAASALARDGFSVRYDAASQGYLVDLPSTSEFRFESGREDASYWHGYAQTGFYTGTIIDVLKPRSTNPEIQLAYTSLSVTSGYYSSQFGFTAFGLATPDSGIPVTGSANYDALIVGAPLDVSGSVGGRATFQFNFGAGTLGGHFDPILSDNGVSTNLGSYNFVNTVFGIGRPTFSGQLSRTGANSLGAFDGRFTGPAAQELMARWTAPYLNPTTQQWQEMFGVMVGRSP